MAFPILDKFEKGECEKCNNSAVYLITKYLQPAWIHIVCDDCLKDCKDSIVIGSFQLGMLPKQYYV